MSVALGWRKAAAMGCESKLDKQERRRCGITNFIVELYTNFTVDLFYY